MNLVVRNISLPSDILQIYKKAYFCNYKTWEQNLYCVKLMYVTIG